MTIVVLWAVMGLVFGFATGFVICSLCCISKINAALRGKEQDECETDYEDNGED